MRYRIERFERVTAANLQDTMTALEGLVGASVRDYLSPVATTTWQRSSHSVAVELERLDAAQHALVGSLDGQVMAHRGDQFST